MKTRILLGIAVAPWRDGKPTPKVVQAHFRENTQKHHKNQKNSVHLSMLFHYRKCSIDDLESLLWISRKTFIDAFEKENNPEDFQRYIDAAFRRETISDQLKNKKIHFYFVYVNDELAGYFKLNEAGAQSDINDPETVELERIYVLEDFQGKNIGTRMLDEVNTIARKLGATYLWLGVWEENRSAIRFYERYGFVKFGEHPYAVNTDIQTDWLMKLELKNHASL